MLNGIVSDLSHNGLDYIFEIKEVQSMALPVIGLIEYLVNGGVYCILVILGIRL